MIAVAATCIVCNVVFYIFVESAGVVVAYMALYFSVFGLESVTNILYLQIELRVPPESLSSSLVIVMTSSVFFSSLAPLFTLLPAPIPVFIVVGMLTLIVVMSMFLPKAGYFLNQPSEKEGKDGALMDESNIREPVMFDSLYLPMNIGTLQFSESYTERKEQSMRSRLGESGMEPTQVENIPFKRLASVNKQQWIASYDEEDDEDYFHRYNSPKRLPGRVWTSLDPI